MITAVLMSNGEEMGRISMHKVPTNISVFAGFSDIDWSDCQTQNFRLIKRRGKIAIYEFSPLILTDVSVTESDFDPFDGPASLN